MYKRVFPEAYKICVCVMLFTCRIINIFAALQHDFIKSSSKVMYQLSLNRCKKDIFLSFLSGLKPSVIIHMKQVNNCLHYM